MTLVKRLEWTKEEHGWRAHTPWGAYMIERAKWPGALGLWYVSFRSGEIDDCYCETDTAAMKACQADFAKRVSECLEVDK